MKTSPPLLVHSRPYLLLLPLLAVLLFGNCNGGVRGMLNNMDVRRRERLQAVVQQRQAARTAARHQLRGPARRAAYLRIEQASNAGIDSALATSFERRKLRNRRNKVERQLLLAPPGPTGRQ